MNTHQILKPFDFSNGNPDSPLPFGTALEIIDRDTLTTNDQQPTVRLSEPIVEGDRGYPPVNSLAVNDETGIPGERYDLAPGCSNINWPQEVRECVAFRGYPESMAEAAAR